MDARKAFERFEKTGSGLLPFFVVAGLFIAATVPVVNLWTKVPAIDPDLTQGVIYTSARLAKTIGYGVAERPIMPDSPNFETVQVQREKLSEAFPIDEYQYVGAFEVASTEFHVYWV